MPIIAKASGEGNANPIPPGVHVAICYALYDIGSHFSQQFNKMNHKIMLSWEIPEERIEVERDGKKVNLPRAISKEYTLSLNEKANLLKDLQSWRGKKFTEDELKGFHIEKLLGVPCQLNVIHNDKGYANIATIMPVPKGFKAKKPENPMINYSIEDHGRAIPAGCPEFIRKKIEASQEWPNLGGEVPHEEVPVEENLEIVEENIPF